MARFVLVCLSEELIEGKGHPVEVDGLRIALFRHEGRVHALQGRCPHANGPLGHGWIEEGEALCPLHRWRFRLDDGRCTSVRGESVHVFRSEERDGEIWVEA